MAEARTTDSTQHEAVRSAADSAVAAAAAVTKKLQEDHPFAPPVPSPPALESKGAYTPLISLAREIENQKKKASNSLDGKINFCFSKEATGQIKKFDSALAHGDIPTIEGLTKSLWEDGSDRLMYMYIAAELHKNLEDNDVDVELCRGGLLVYKKGEQRGVMFAEDGTAVVKAVSWGMDGKAIVSPKPVPVKAPEDLMKEVSDSLSRSEPPPSSAPAKHLFDIPRLICPPTMAPGYQWDPGFARPNNLPTFDCDPGMTLHRDRVCKEPTLQMSPLLRGQE